MPSALQIQLAVAPCYVLPTNCAIQWSCLWPRSN